MTATVSPDLEHEIAAWGRSLKARNRSPKTIRSYLESARLLAEFLAAEGRPTDPAMIRRTDIEAFVTDQLERWTASTAATRYRCIQQLFKHLVDVEVIEVSPMARMAPPSIPEAPVPVFTAVELKQLVKACAGGGFENRRDLAIVRMFIYTPVRLGEAAGIRLEDLELDDAVVRVTGKGSRTRDLPLKPKAVESLDNYLRERRKHTRASEPWLWLGIRGRLTDSGIAQVLERRAGKAGIKGMHAHRFRHTFSHQWLAEGNAEGDLQRLAGWRSPQMLSRYGASAADERARDAYRRSSLWDDL